MSIPGGLKEHFTGTGKHKVPKKSFESIEEANLFMDSNGIKGKTAYLCSFCGKYHIGG
jgi:hypothetical protein